MGQIYDASLVGVKDSVVDEFLLLNALQIPFLSLVGFGDEVSNTTHEWYEDEMFGKSGVVNNSGAVGSTDTTFVVVDESMFRVGHVIQAAGEDELMLITAINTTTHTLTVTRGFQGTTASGFADSIAVHVMFINGVEGQAARDARYKARTKVTNYTQIFDETIDISGTAEAVLQHGVANEYEKEKQKKILELAWQLENACINGASYSSGTNSKMKGLRSFITTNVVNGGSADVTDTMLNTCVDNVWSAGGMKSGGQYVFMCHPTQKRMLAKLLASYVKVDRDDRTRGLVVDKIATDFGTFDVHMNSNLRNTEIMFIDINRIKVRPLRTRNWFHQYLGKVGDSEKGQVIGEFTLQVEQQKAHSRIYGLDIT